MFGREERSTNKFVLRERDRIRKAKEMADRTAELDIIKSVMLTAEFECLGLAVYEKALKYRERTKQREKQLWNTSLTLISNGQLENVGNVDSCWDVRREALRSLLEQERQLHIRELSKIDLAIYQQRT